MPDYGDMIRQAGVDVDFSKIDCTIEDEIIAAAADADAVIGAAKIVSVATSATKNPLLMISSLLCLMCYLILLSGLCVDCNF